MWDSREQDAGGPKDRETHAASGTPVFTWPDSCRCVEVGGGRRRMGSRRDDSSAAAKLATCRSVVFRISFSSGLQHSSLLAQRVSGQKA